MIPSSSAARTMAGEGTAPERLVRQPLGLGAIHGNAEFLAGLHNGRDEFFPGSLHVKHRSFGVELAESDSLSYLVGLRIGDRLAVLRGICLQRLAVFITPPARQARVHVFTAKRYAVTEPADARTREPEFSIQYFLS